MTRVHTIVPPSPLALRVESYVRYLQLAVVCTMSIHIAFGVVINIHRRQSAHRNRARGRGGGFALMPTQKGDEHFPFAGVGRVWIWWRHQMHSLPFPDSDQLLTNNNELSWSVSIVHLFVNSHVTRIDTQSAEPEHNYYRIFHEKTTHQNVNILLRFITVPKAQISVTTEHIIYS